MKKFIISVNLLGYVVNTGRIPADIFDSTKVREQFINEDNVLIFTRNTNKELIQKAREVFTSVYIVQDEKQLNELLSIVEKEQFQPYVFVEEEYALDGDYQLSGSLLIKELTTKQADSTIQLKDAFKATDIEIIYMTETEDDYFAVSKINKEVEV